jgi:xanthine/uracil/vitamin C permease (AzgA family)
MGLGCLAIMTILMSRGFKAAIIVGIATTTIISWIPGHSASYLGPNSIIPGAQQYSPRSSKHAVGSSTLLLGGGMLGRQLW